MVKDIVIVGTGGHARDMVWLIEDNNQALERVPEPEATKWNILGFIDNNPSSDKVDGYPVIGNDDWLVNCDKELAVVIAVGDGKLRKILYETYQQNEKLYFPTLISHTVHMSPRCRIGQGCMICSSVEMTVNIDVGNFVLINIGCTVEHDDCLEDYVTLNPGVNVSGNVHIGELSNIGTGSKIIQGINIGREVIAGAGTVIIRDTEDSCTIVGNPARVVKRRV